MAVPALAFRISPKDDDLDIDPATGKVRLVVGTEEVLQSLKRRLLMWEGEFFWDGRDGVPWSEFLGKKNIAMLQYEILRELRRDRRLSEIIEVRVSEYDPASRTVTVLFAGVFQDSLVTATWEVPLG